MTDEKLLLTLFTSLVSTLSWYNNSVCWQVAILSVRCCKPTSKQRRNNDVDTTSVKRRHINFHFRLFFQRLSNVATQRRNNVFTTKNVHWVTISTNKFPLIHRHIWQLLLFSGLTSNSWCVIKCHLQIIFFIISI